VAASEGGGAGNTSSAMAGSETAFLACVSMEPPRWTLLDTRGLGRSVRDMIWLRLVDL